MLVECGNAETIFILNYSAIEMIQRIFKQLMNKSFKSYYLKTEPIFLMSTRLNIYIIALQIKLLLSKEKHGVAN